MKTLAPGTARPAASVTLPLISSPWERMTAQARVASMAASIAGRGTRGRAAVRHRLLARSRPARIQRRPVREARLPAGLRGRGLGQVESVDAVGDARQPVGLVARLRIGDGE